ncbi:MAG: hypothetical protein ABW252_11330 [Polyangiales bacterium]
MHTRDERRRRRSDDAREALELQLAHVRDAARLDALVLASDEGLSIAFSGEEELCTELAALAPFLPHELDAPHADGADALRVMPLSLGAVPLLLVSYCRDQAPDGLETWLAHASQGVVRILDA